MHACAELFNEEQMRTIRIQIRANNSIKVNLNSVKR